MVQNCLENLDIKPEAKKSIIKKNVVLIEQDNQRFILKERRLKEKNFFQRFRFFNELRVYAALRNRKLQDLKVPKSYIEDQAKSLLLEFIEIDKTKTIDLQTFIRSYIELQQIKVERKLFLDLYSKVFLSYFYRVCVVSLITIRKKVNLTTALKSIKLYIKLSARKEKYNQKYWIHGDLHGNNYFKDKNNTLYFIDFENMFYTRKWPMTEIIGKCFVFSNDKVDFSSKYLKAYLNEFYNGNQINHKSLFLEFRFGLLHHAIHQIAQTNSPLKREAYLNLLHKCLNFQKFQEWFEINLLIK